MDVAKAVILASDLVIIPVQPRQADVSATMRTIAPVQEAGVFKETLKSVIAINRRIVNTAIGHAIRETLADLQTPVLTQMFAAAPSFRKFSEREDSPRQRSPQQCRPGDRSAR